MASFERSGHGYDSGFGQQAGNFSSGADEYGSGGNYSESTNDGYNRQMPKVEGQLVKVFCEARPEYYVTVNGNHVGLASGNDSNKRQQFVKDSRWSNRVKDSSGSPAFALVHQETGLALKHGNDLYDKVSLQEYDPNTLDESVLWTQSNDVGGGYQCLRPVGNIHLNLDASHGDEGHGGSVSEGTELILFEWKKQENQKWKMIPISSEESQNYGGEAGYGGGGSHGEGYGGGRDGAGYGGGRGGEGYGGGRDGAGYGGGSHGEGYGGGRGGEGYGGGRDGEGYGGGRNGAGYGGERRYGGGYGGNNEY